MLPPSRTLLGLVLATVLALAARRMRSLSPGGAWAAVVVGTCAAAAGWHWCAVLLAFFTASSLLSRWRSASKDARTVSVIAKGGARDAWQVGANGGVFALSAIGAAFAPSPWWSLAGLGALAAATADTWATEVGTAVGGTPRHIVGWRAVPPGTSGAVTIAGTAAMAAGAFFIGTAALLAGFPREVAGPVIGGGVAGAMTDTVLGATVQERRWCVSCGRATERAVHDCGRATERRGGWGWLDNDVVNLTSCVAGALVALLCGRVS